MSSVLPDSVPTRSRRRRGARAFRWFGTTMVVAGVAVLVWAFVVWRWEDPFTSIYTAYAQRGLESQLATAVQQTRVVPAPPRARPVAVVASVRREARAFRLHAKADTAIGRIRVPRLHLNMILVEGTDKGSLKKGPGRDARTFMPGEGKLVYIAGHRTTYSAPFADIDTLRRGDRITVQMPYGTFVYVVDRHRIVDNNDMSVLKSGVGEEIALQACHPRFFATQRYIVWAAPARRSKVGGRVFALPAAKPVPA